MAQEQAQTKSEAPSHAHGFSFTMEQQEGYEFRVKFDWPDVAELVLDEPEPLGKKRGPNAARLVAAAVANCLSASLVFCMQGKFKQKPGPVKAKVSGRLERNEKGRFRIEGIDVAISLSDEAGAIQHLDRCAEQFEDFCIVTESIRKGIPVKVSVTDATGQTVYQGG